MHAQDLGLSGDVAVQAGWPAYSIPGAEYGMRPAYQFPKADSPMQSAMLQGGVKYVFFADEGHGIEGSENLSTRIHGETSPSLAGNTGVGTTPHPGDVLSIATFRSAYWRLGSIVYWLASNPS